MVGLWETAEVGNSFLKPWMEIKDNNKLERKAAAWGKVLKNRINLKNLFWVTII